MSKYIEPPLSRDEMKRLVQYGFEMGWLSVRPDATLPEPRKVLAFDKDLSPDLRLSRTGSYERDTLGHRR